MLPQPRTKPSWMSGHWPKEVGHVCSASFQMVAIVTFSQSNKICSRDSGDSLHLAQLALWAYCGMSSQNFPIRKWIPALHSANQSMLSIHCCAISLPLLQMAAAIASLGPLLVGTSKKSFLGALLERPNSEGTYKRRQTSPQERGWATAATVACAVQQGAL